MALVKTDNTIISMRGRFGGVYFKHDNAGQHIQAMPRVWNYTRSPAQMGSWGEGSPFMSVGIRGYSGAAGLWLLALLAAYSAAWALWSTYYYFARKDGEDRHLTGFNWYIYYALAFPECERPPFWKPPHSPGELPNFIVTYKGLWTYEHTPIEWPADCPSDYYWRGLDHHEKPSYRSDDLKWYLWWKETRWVISQGLDFEDPDTTFYSSGADIVDYYRNPKTKKWSHVYFGRPKEVHLPH